MKFSGKKHSEEESEIIMSFIYRLIVNALRGILNKIYLFFNNHYQLFFCWPKSALFSFSYIFPSNILFSLYLWDHGISNSKLAPAVVETGNLLFMIDQLYL